jgi:hypothetical protein
MADITSDGRVVITANESKCCHFVTCQDQISPCMLTFGVIGFRRISAGYPNCTAKCITELF